MSDYPAFVPGLPIKRYNACISPDQQAIPHIEPVFVVRGDGTEFSRFEVNRRYYPEFDYIIQMFIDTKLPNIVL